MGGACHPRHQFCSWSSGQVRRGCAGGGDHGEVGARPLDRPPDAGYRARPTFESEDSVAVVYRALLPRGGLQHLCSRRGSGLSVD